MRKYTLSPVKEAKKMLSGGSPNGNCVTVTPERRFGGATFSVAAVLPLMVGLLLASFAPHIKNESVVPLLCGSFGSVTVELWNWVTDSWEDLDWFDAELSIVAQIIKALEPYGGVSVTDVQGNELDPDDLPNPNTGDGGSDCVISIDQDYYDTDRGFQWIRTRIETHLNEILEELT
jgi:hypothetical protein